MAIFRGEIRSRTMEMDTGLAVILPYDSFQEMPPAKTLYLLHGLKQSAGAWLNMSSIGRYAKEHNLAVVMPEVQRSFYTDMEMGLAYSTTTVLTAVARLELTPSIPTFASMEVRAAKTDERRANKNHMDEIPPLKCFRPHPQLHKMRRP